MRKEKIARFRLDIIITSDGKWIQNDNAASEDFGILGKLTSKQGFKCYYLAMLDFVELTRPVRQ